MIHPTRIKARLWYLPQNGSPVFRGARVIEATDNPQKAARKAFADIGGPRYRVDYVRVTCEELGMVELPGCLA